MGAALRARHRVDLVDDDRLDVAQALPCPRGQQQVQRLGCRDEDVGWVASHPLALPLRRVTGAHPDGRLDDVGPEPLGREARPPQRRAQVAVDVGRQRLERRDVHDPGRLVPVGPGIGHAAVDGVQERRQRLARAGRREDQGVVTPGDRRPARGLRPGGCAEGGAEPGRDGRREARQHLGRRRLVDDGVGTVRGSRGRGG